MNYLDEQLLSSLSGHLDEGYTHQELQLIFGDTLNRYPKAYLNFLHCFGKYNFFFGGLDHDPTKLNEYLSSVKSCISSFTNSEAAIKETEGLIVFLSSQGCNWYLFRLEDGDNPPVYFCNESSEWLVPKVQWSSFTEMLRSHARF